MLQPDARLSARPIFDAADGLFCDDRWCDYNRMCGPNVGHDMRLLLQFRDYVHLSLIFDRLTAKAYYCCSVRLTCSPTLKCVYTVAVRYLQGRSKHNTPPKNMQYLHSQWSDFKNSWSCLILTLLWIYGQFMHKIWTFYVILFLSDSLRFYTLTDNNIWTLWLWPLTFRSHP